MLLRFGRGGHSATREAKMNDVTSDRWLSVDAIAAYLGGKRYTIYKWVERKNMPAHKERDEWVRSGQASDSNETRKPK